MQGNQAQASSVRSPRPISKPCQPPGRFTTRRWRIPAPGSATRAHTTSSSRHWSLVSTGARAKPFRKLSLSLWHSIFLTPLHTRHLVAILYLEAVSIWSHPLESLDTYNGHSRYSLDSLLTQLYIHIYIYRYIEKCGMDTDFCFGNFVQEFNN